MNIVKIPTTYLLSTEKTAYNILGLLGVRTIQLIIHNTSKVYDLLKTGDVFVGTDKSNSIYLLQRSCTDANEILCKATAIRIPSRALAEQYLCAFPGQTRDSLICTTARLNAILCDISDSICIVIE